MAKNGKAATANGTERETPHAGNSVLLARSGVSSSEDFRNLMCALMTDVIQGDVSPDVVNAACNAGRGLLKMVEMEYKASQGAANRSFPLSRRIPETTAAA